MPHANSPVKYCISNSLVIYTIYLQAVLTGWHPIFLNNLTIVKSFFFNWSPLLPVFYIIVVYKFCYTFHHHLPDSLLLFTRKAYLILLTSLLITTSCTQLLLCIPFPFSSGLSFRTSSSYGKISWWLFVCKWPCFLLKFTRLFGRI